MEYLHSKKIFSCSLLLLLFHISPLSTSATNYTLPQLYFINCGSSSSVVNGSRTFVGDVNSDITVDKSSTVQDPGSSITELYRSARIFRKPSKYELDIVQNGTHVVRFHFFPFSALGNLTYARFSVEVSEFRILSNFSIQNNRSFNFPLIEEFLVTIPVGKVRIKFVPEDKNCFGFINAMEVFVGLVDLITDPSTGVTGQGTKYNYTGLLIYPLRVIHRINVGGSNVTDELMRSWIADDPYLLNKDRAKNSDPYSGPLNPVALDFAPYPVYSTAKELSSSGGSSQLSSSRIVWRFDVRKGAKHLVRVHFCDIVSNTTNEFVQFDFFIGSKFEQVIYPYGWGYVSASPFYIDFVIDSDDSGFMNISVGPRNDSRPQTAFLNGLEILEQVTERGSSQGGSGSMKGRLGIIIGSVVGSLVLVVIFMAWLYLCLRKRQSKPDESFNYPLVPLYGGSSHTKRKDITVSGSSHDLNLGLKVSLSEILYATKNFDKKLVVGEGGFGKVYKGMLRNGTKVAVKRSEPGHGQGIAEFNTEVIVLSKIRHHHLVSLIGYCDEMDEMILVYEFMEKGTLRDHLYGELRLMSELSWVQRLGICIGSAKGIHYLHTGSSGAIIHRDIKSTNILLDNNYVAKVADFGLSRSGPPDHTHVSTDVKGSFGYLDPDYFRCLQLTQKSDVYSFGVVLLEVLCARPAICVSLPREQVNLAEWGLAWQRKGQLEKIVDPSLVGDINADSLRKFGETVEKCLEEYGADRPNMVDVLWDLEYSLQLQLTARPRAPYEDSTTDISMGFQTNIIQRLPSHSVPIGEDEQEQPRDSCSFSDASQVNAFEEFSLLRIHEAR